MTHRTQTADTNRLRPGMLICTPKFIRDDVPTVGKVLIVRSWGNRPNDDDFGESLLMDSNGDVYDYSTSDFPATVEVITNAWGKIPTSTRKNPRKRKSPVRQVARKRKAAPKRRKKVARKRKAPARKKTAKRRKKAAPKRQVPLAQQIKLAEAALKGK